jgi:hypothetical protein
MEFSQLFPSSTPLIKTKYIPNHLVKKSCVRTAIKDPSDFGVNFSIRMVFVGLLPQNFV